ncbi:MAG TPA: sulfite exporter TauE/SafE family protein [Saprospiraceae bacterium]|nr:sulfite exporter TauE/SafE family protein [Saprospiraceae bacterium]HMQ82717.1 sulfite exporter TauE/SafE family protein [Saprospiraceae bacterium]
MDYFIISLAAFVAAMLTFFSGFGLGTILTPVFAIFFPIDLAIALTGVVHFFNGLFKLVLVGKHAEKAILLRFGIPAVVAAFVGAWLLLQIAAVPILYRYEWLGRTFEVSPVKLIIAVLLIGFAIMELLPFFERFQIDKKHLPLGGVLSGFFGGLSGHQGALRSAFLLRAGMSKEAFIGTATLIAVFIDFTRLGVYATRFGEMSLHQQMPLILSATLAAITGAYLGNRLLKKITLKFIQRLVAVLLILLSLALGLGLI